MGLLSGVKNSFSGITNSFNEAAAEMGFAAQKLPAPNKTRPRKPIIDPSVVVRSGPNLGGSNNTQNPPNPKTPPVRPPRNQPPRPDIRDIRDISVALPATTKAATFKIKLPQRSEKR